jgi:hypothetical protein
MRYLLLALCAMVLACGDFEGDMTITGWSKTAYLTSMDLSAHASAQASFREINGASAITVQFEVVDNSPPVPFRFIAPTAKITWSVQGNSITRTVSIRDGMAVTGVGEHISIDLWDNAIPLDPSIPPLPAQQVPYIVNMTAGPGTRGPSQIAPTLIPYIETVNVLGVSLAGYGYSTATNAGAGSGVGIIDLTDYPGTTGLFFSVTNNHTPVPGGTILVRGIGAGGLTTFACTESLAGTWIPVPPSTSEIRFTVNPADVANTYLISASLAVEG